MISFGFINPRTLEPGGSDPARGAIFKNNIFPLNYISGNTYVILESVLTLTGVYVMSFSNVQIFHKNTKRVPLTRFVEFCINIV